MTLSPGDRLGHYEIQARVGAGGMGEVHRARDTRLDRTVAIKVLSREQTDRSEFQLRFEREARLIAAFSHPHICTVFDFARDGDTHYLVMEFLDGETLADRLRKGRLRLDELLRYAVEICEALGQAHRNGIVHRDLKPGNVMLTRAGAKLLDFGLARPIHVDSHADATTVTQSITNAGAIVGTYPYMSPEQLQGGEVDARSDIFSFGAMLFEMATSRRAFQGDSAASLIAAVLEHEPPPLPDLRPDAPPALDWLIRGCLKKEPDQRWQSAQDLKLQLERLREAPSAGASAVPGKRFRWLPVAAALLAGAIAGSALWAWLGPRPKLPKVPASLQFEISPPTGGLFTTSTQASVPAVAASVSPDGSTIAFVAEAAGPPMIWLRTLRDSEPHPLAGTEGAQQVYWSPDSHSLAFFALNSLKRIDLSGGPARVLAPASVDARGAAWLASGEIVYAHTIRASMMQVPAAGGTPREVFRSAEKVWWPTPLPDGRHFLYLNRSKGGLFVGSLDGTSSDRVVETDWGGAYAEPGFVFFIRDGALLAQAFDVSSFRLSGEPAVIAKGVGGASNAMAGFSVSSSGTLSYAPILLPRTRLSWNDRRGLFLTDASEPGHFLDFRLSPDGTRIAWSRIDPSTFSGDIWINQPDRSITTRFTSDRLLEAGPIWSHDASTILYRANRTGVINWYLRELGSSTDQQVLFTEDRQWNAHGSSYNIMPTDWTADGSTIIYTAGSDAGYDIFAFPMAPPRIPFPLARSPFHELQGVLSPDGRWLAFASNESGRFEVFVQSYPDGKRHQQISAGGASEPRWRADGRELFILTATQKIAAVPFNPSGEFGKPQELFSIATGRSVNPYSTSYVPEPDGQRFLVNRLLEQEPGGSIHVIVGWQALLNR